MKILFVVHQFFPMHYTGTEKFLLNLATSIQKWGHKVKVATYSFYEDASYPVDEKGVLSREFMFKGIEVLAFQQKRPPYDLNWGIENSGLKSYAETVLQKEQPDIVHLAHGMRTSEFAFAAKKLGIPYLVTMTDFFLMCPRCILYTSGRALCNGPQNGAACATECPEFPTDYIARRLELGKIVLRDASCVVAPSRFLGSLFKNEFPFLDPIVLPYGIDFSRLIRRTAESGGKRPLTFLFAGQVDYHKGVHVLIDAFLKVTGEVQLQIYGSGPDLAVRNFKESSKHDPRIQFCGVYKEDQVGEIFGTADLVIVPSNWHENNTIVMREALASGVPCVVSNAGGMIEKIQDGVNGFIFRMGDSEHLREILQNIVSNPGLLRLLRKNVPSYALTSVEQEAFVYERTYHSILSSSIS